jgi:hypothetical protein
MGIGQTTRGKENAVNLKDESRHKEQAHDLSQKMSYWSEMRSLIMHEDNLVNHRFSWLLTYEGFLMGGFFLVQNGLLSNNVSVGVVIAAEIFMLPVMLASMWICFITGQTISAAYRQTATVYHTWIRRYPEENWERSDVPPWFSPFTKGNHRGNPTKPPANSEFPPILGGFNYHPLGKTLRIPFILFAINFLGAMACIGIAIYVHGHPTSLHPPAAPSSASQAPVK